MKTPRGTMVLAGVVALSAGIMAGRGETPANGDKLDALAQQIIETMVKVPGTKAGHRVVHAKGLVCGGTFVATPAAAGLSKAAHLQGGQVAVTVRFSLGAPDPLAADNAHNTGPRGMAIRFALPGGDQCDIVAMSHQGFVVGNGEEFLELQKAIVATDPSKPHPWPIEQFVTTHPRALKFVQENAVVPASFAMEQFFSNDTFVLVNKDGAKQTMRYQIVPELGRKDLSDAETTAKGQEFLMEDMKERVSKGPVTYRLVAQLPNAGDVTSDPSLVWPEDRKTVELGTIRITSVDAKTEETEKALAFDPTNLTEGIELSDDELPALRSKVYALAVMHRNGQ